MQLEVAPAVLRFRQPLKTAFGELRDRVLLHVTLTAADGLTGRGEAAPLEPYDGVSLDAVSAALAAYRPVLAAGDGLQGGALLDACRAAADLPPALAAIDMALWDLAGRRAGRPVCELLTDDPAMSLPVNAMIVATDRRGAATEAAAAVRAGYRTLKLKVGVGDDAGRVAAVRAAAGPDVALRLDANGAWSVDEAARTLAALAPAGPELVEEPVHGVSGIRALGDRTDVALAVDETAGELGGLGVGDLVCLKISRCGGIAGLLAAAALVRARGAGIYVSSSFDGPLGIAAAIHAAAALAPLPACGLATLELFAAPVPEALTVHDGRIFVPRGPGLY